MVEPAGDPAIEAIVSPAERATAGRALRSGVPRSANGAWRPAADRANPLDVLEAQAATRVKELGPIRYERMAESAFAFFRGAAAVMSMDLASTASTGIRVQACGDAHVNNFGFFASPERNLVFDINDFDETVPGPWEWDVKRLCTSLHVIGRQRGWSADECDQIVVAAARTYREHVADYATWTTLDLWYERAEIKGVIERFPTKYRSTMERDMRKARRKDHLRAVSKLTHVMYGQRRFIDNPPLVVHLSETENDLAEVNGLIETYKASLPEERQYMFERYRLLDVARKVVGVGSVGTRCWIGLFEGRDDPADLIVLQAKEAGPSVLEPYVGESQLGHHGKRVVVGQRLIQSASDVFLGWSEGPETGRNYYVRQLWDYKGQGDPMVMDFRNLSHYGALCAWILARSHARTGDAAMIAGYLGKSAKFDVAIAAFAAQYASTNEADHALLAASLDRGVI
jgi:uncharacterized protein (DUF2252 family)